MSYSFTKANEHFMYTYAPVTARGTSYSYIAWVMHTAVAASEEQLVAWTNTVDSVNYTHLSLYDSGNELWMDRKTSTGPTNSLVHTTSPNPPSNSWVMVHGRHGSATDNIIGFGGGNEVSDATSIVPAMTIDRFLIGVRFPGDTDEAYEGKIAIVAFYNNYKLTTGDLAALLTMPPSDHAGSYANCLSYFDMRTDQGTSLINDQKSSNHLTLGGTTGTPTFSSDNPTFASTPAGRMLLTGIG